MSQFALHGSGLYLPERKHAHIYHSQELPPLRNPYGCLTGGFSSISKAARPAAAGGTTPLTILGTLAWWVRADLGVTIGTGVSAWADQSGNGVDFIQGTAANQPTFSSSGGPNGTATIIGDGTNDKLLATWSRVAPGTQPFYIWLIAKQVTWVSNRWLCGDFSTSGFAIRQRTATPGLAGILTTHSTVNNAATIGSYFRIECQLTNSTSDYLKIGSTNVTGINMGSTAGSGGFGLFDANPGAFTGANVEIAEAFCFLGTPSGTDRTNLDAYVTGRYGSGLV